MKSYVDFINTQRSRLVTSINCNIDTARTYRLQIDELEAGSDEFNHKFKFMLNLRERALNEITSALLFDIINEDEFDYLYGEVSEYHSVPYCNLGDVKGDAK